MRRNFAQHHPGLAAPASLKKLIHDPLLREAYRCQRHNGTESAGRQFRPSFHKADRKAGNFKHPGASLLPAALYRNPVDFVTRRRSIRIDG